MRKDTHLLNGRGFLRYKKGIYNVIKKNKMLKGELHGYGCLYVF